MSPTLPDYITNLEPLNSCPVNPYENIVIYDIKLTYEIMEIDSNIEYNCFHINSNKVATRDTESRKPHTGEYDAHTSLVSLVPLNVKSNLASASLILPKMR